MALFADPPGIIALKLAAVLVLVLLNGFFVASEFAIVKVRSTQLAPRTRQGDRRAKMATHVNTHLDAYLSACQLGITLASLGLGWIGEPAVARLLEPLFFAVGMREPVVLHAAAFVVAFTFITFLHIVFGELAPKSIAIRHAEDSALALSRPLHVFYVMFKPVIWALNGFANASLRVVGFDPATSTEAAHSEAELREMLIRGTAASGGAGKERSRFLVNLLDLGDLKTGDVMTPVTRVVVLDVTKPLADNIRVAEDSGYSRFPLIDGSPDHVTGMVHYKDISRITRKDRPEQALEDVKRDIPLIPETRGVQELLSDFIKRGQHMAIVVDEHGRTVGLVTMEDLFEEVFGNIRDEFDVEPESTYKQLADGHYLVDGTMSLHDLEHLVGGTLKRPGITTVSGLVIDALGRIPVGGETARIRDLTFTVREVGRRRIRKVEVQRLPGAATSLPSET